MDINDNFKEIWNMNVSANFRNKLENNINFHDKLVKNMHQLSILVKELDFNV
jgi:hypothetical protein